MIAFDEIIIIQIVKKFRMSAAFLMNNSVLLKVTSLGIKEGIITYVFKCLTEMLHFEQEQAKIKTACTVRFYSHT